MGISLPQLPQPGETTRAVLGEVGDAWLLVFGALALSLTLAQARHAVLLTVLFATATALGYGLLADFSDLLFGFWGTAILVLRALFPAACKITDSCRAANRPMARRPAPAARHRLSLPGRAGCRPPIVVPESLCAGIPVICGLAARKKRDEGENSHARSGRRQSNSLIGRKQKAAPEGWSGFKSCSRVCENADNPAALSQARLRDYFFFAFLAASSSRAAWAAARRATGTRNGEQLT